MGDKEREKGENELEQGIEGDVRGVRVSAESGVSMSDGMCAGSAQRDCGLGVGVNGINAGASAEKTGVELLCRK